MGKQILVVDNNPVIIRLFENFLSKLGHEVQTAANGLIALEIINNYVPDIMFVDLVMPTINGRQFCRAVREKPTFDNTVIVIVTATAAEDEEIFFHQFGADYCIGKGPFNEMAQYILEVMELPRHFIQEGDKEFIYGSDRLYKREVTKELLVSNKHLEMILRYVSDGVIEFTIDRKIIFSNQAVEKITEQSENSLLSTDVLQLFEEKDRIIVQKKIVEANQKREATRLDIPLRLGKRMVMIDFLPLSDDRQKCCIAVAHDVSSELEKEVAENRLEKQVKIAHVARLSAIGELASGIAHEMRQPISVIDLAGTYLQEIIGKEQTEHQAVVDKIRSQCKRLSVLSENVRLFTKPNDESNHHLVFSETLERALSFFKEQFRLHQITILQEIPDSLPKVQINPYKFEQIFVNFLSNARYAVDARAEMETSGYAKEVGIKIYQTDAKIIIEVSDNGIGMSPEVRRQCLDSFFTTKDGKEATGLGLTIVASMVANFGGLLEIESQEGHGSTFRIIVPGVTIMVGP